MLIGRKGRNQQVPELSSTVLYDAFKVDVYALGDVFAKEFVDVRMLRPPVHWLAAHALAEISRTRGAAAAGSMR